MTCRMDEYLGAYVLNALEPDETRAVHAHLAECRACREEAGSLADTASLLALLTIHDVEELRALEPVAADPAPARGRRRRLALAGAAAALVAASVLGGAGVLHGGAGHATAGVVQTVDPTTHVQAAVTRAGHDWGTQLHLALSGAYPSGRCSLVARSRDGRSDVAATWVADRQGAASVDGVTAIPADRLSELDVVTDSGALLVRIAMPHPGN